jgi:hypothetical protein
MAEKRFPVGSKLAWHSDFHNRPVYYEVVSVVPRVVLNLQTYTKHNLDSMGYPSWDKLPAVRLMEDPFVTWIREVREDV